MSAWSEEQIELATRLWAEGFSAAQIAARLRGVSRSAMIGFAHRNRDRFPARRPAYVLATQARSRKAREAKPARQARPRNVAKPATMPAPRPVACPAPAGPTLPFLDAATEGLCLFYAGGHLSPAGPDMPVCGAPRASGRYCAHHAQRATQTGQALLEAAE